MKKIDISKLPTQVRLVSEDQLRAEKALAAKSSVFAVIVAAKLVVLSTAVVVLAISQYKHNRKFRDNVDRFWDEIPDTVKRKVDDVRDTVSGLADKAQEKSDEVADTVKSKVEETSDNVSDFADKVENKADKAKDLGRKVESKARNASS